jgi:DMSO reductase anchor subunit
MAATDMKTNAPIRFTVGAAIGFTLISLSVLAIDRSNRQPTLERPFQVDEFLVALVLLGFVVPLAGFALLRLCRVRPAAVPSLAGWLATIVVSLIVRQLFFRGVGPALIYGLCAAICYGCAALASVEP